MKTPAAFSIFGALVPVEYKEDLIGDEDADGTYCAQSQTITIDASLEDDLFFMALLHEFFHAVCCRTSISQGIDKNLEEVIVDAFSKAIVENFILKPR